MFEDCGPRVADHPPVISRFKSYVPPTPETPKEPNEKKSLEDSSSSAATSPNPFISPKPEKRASTSNLDRFRSPLSQLRCPLYASKKRSRMQIVKDSDAVVAKQPRLNLFSSRATDKSCREIKPRQNLLAPECTSNCRIPDLSSDSSAPECASNCRISDLSSDSSAPECASNCRISDLSFGKRFVVDSPREQDCTNGGVAHFSLDRVKKWSQTTKREFCQLRLIRKVPHLSLIRFAKLLYFLISSQNRT